MKQLMIIILALLFTLITASAVSADGPQPTDAQIALSACTGIPIDTLIEAQQRFDTWYGWEHHLVTQRDWESTYTGRVNAFAYAIGCIQVLDEAPDGHNVLPFRFLILVPQLKRWAYPD